MIRRFLLVSLMLALVGCAGQGTPTRSPQLPSPTIGLTYIPNVQFSPFYLAEADGMFVAAGVRPVLRHHGAAEGLFTALAAGQEQFVLAGGDEMLQARASGLDLVAVAAYYRSYPVRVIVPADSGITRLADLRGRTIGLPGRYGENWFGLLVALGSAGLSERDVQIKEIGFTQQAALTTKKVDAVVGFVNNDSVQFELSGMKVRNLPITSAKVPLVGISLVTTAAYAQANPDVVKAVCRAMLDGIQIAVTNPDRALSVSAKYVPLLSSPAAAKAAAATLKGTAKVWAPDGEVDGHFDSAQWSEMADFMHSEGLTAERVDPMTAMSNAFLPPAEG